MKTKSKKPSVKVGLYPAKEYQKILQDITNLLESARRTSARAVNSVMTATYWEVGRRIVLFDQGGKEKAKYGEQIIEKLSEDLTLKFGRGFGRRNLFQMRSFFLAFPKGKVQTLSAQSSNESSGFRLPWSHYVRLLAVEDEIARDFYHSEAFRGGWSFRQLDRQISTLFYERTALSRNKTAMLTKGAKPLADDAVCPDEEIKDPFVLEFLNLKDEYSEGDLEEALVQQLESFLLELGDDFTFVGRQKRLRIGDEWYRVDLVFFHRRLRCLVIIDLKIGKFTHADAGQMHLYLNYAREHWTYPYENPPVGLILCAKKDEMVAKYALEGLPNKVLAAQYRTTLPDEKKIVAELEKTRRRLDRK